MVIMIASLHYMFCVMFSSARAGNSELHLPVHCIIVFVELFYVFITRIRGSCPIILETNGNIFSFTSHLH